MDSLPAHLRDSYARDFRLADDAFYSGRLEATSRGREKYWNHWQKYSAPVGVDPYLQGTNFLKRIRLLSGFAARVRTGYCGNGKQVKNCTVSSAITAVGQTIALYVWHGCGMQFERFYSLNNSVVGSFPHLHHLGFQRTFPNLGKPLWWQRCECAAISPSTTV